MRLEDIKDRILDIKDMAYNHSYEMVIEELSKLWDDIDNSLYD